MELTISDEKIKALIQETLVEMIRENRGEFLELVIQDRGDWPGECNKGREKK